MKHLTFIEIDIPTFVPESPEELVTYRFAIDTAYLAQSGIEAIASPAVGLSLNPLYLRQRHLESRR